MSHYLIGTDALRASPYREKEFLFYAETHAMRLNMKTLSYLQSDLYLHMEEGLFKDKYKIGSARLPGYDYSQAGLYFITICTKGMRHDFGEINEGIMHYSPLGKIVEEQWITTERVRESINVKLGEFVVMPNHFHGIIQLSNTANIDSLSRNIFGKQSNNIPSIIRGFKGSVTSEARKMGDLEFAWQPRYHDHIIRSHEAFIKISRYIQNNVANWQQDCYFPSL